MATTAHGDPQPIVRSTHDEQDEESRDEKIQTLLAAGDIEGARAEFERETFASIHSEEPVTLEDAAKYRLPGHTVDLLLEKGDVPAAKTELERLLLEGMASEGSTEATPEFFESLRDVIRRKTATGVSRKSA